MSTSTKLKKKLEEERKAFKSYEGINKKERHIRLTQHMLLHDNYKHLTNNSKVLYNYMKLWAYGSKSFKDTGIFDYSISLACDSCNISNKTAIRCIQELENSGFIERQNNSAVSRQTTQWKFSDKWYSL